LDKVIMEVSATTVLKREDNLFHTAPSRAVVTSGKRRSLLMN